MPRAFPERKAATHLASIRQLDLEDVGEHHLSGTVRLQLAHQVASEDRRFAWIHVLFPLASGYNAILVHHSSHPLFAHTQQCSQLAVSQGIIDLMPLEDGDCDLLVFDRLNAGPVERRAPYS